MYKPIKDQHQAIKFLQTTDGQFLLIQALHLGVKAMKGVPAPRTEISNIADMEFIRDGMMDNRKRASVAEFIGTMRGHLIMSQAFFYASPKATGDDQERMEAISKYVWNFPIF
jgi:hypothetical protein